MMIGLAAVALPLLGEDSIEPLLSAGARHLAAGDFEQALVAFTEASKNLPDDGEALFFKAAALNRLGRFAEAELSLKRAMGLSPVHPDTHFELGWSLVGQGKWDEALSELERFEKEHDGRGQTSEFMGRCHLALGRPEAAERCFADAIMRDPALAETVNAARNLFREERISRADFHADGGWSLGGGLAFAAGRSSNILGVSHEFERLPGFPELDAAFLLGTAELVLRGPLGGSTEIEFKSGAEWISYLGASDADMLNASASLDLRQRLSTDFLGRLQLGFEHAGIGGEPFRTSWLARPALVWQPGESSATEIGGAFGIADYQVILPAPLDRDARSWGVDVTQHFWLADGRARVFAGAFARWDESDGREFDGRFFGAKAGVAAKLPWGVEADASYAAAFDHYHEPSLLSAGGMTRRKGDTQTATVQLSKVMAGGVSLFARYSYLVSSSSVSFYEYDQHLWMAGLRWAF